MKFLQRLSLLSCVLLLLFVSLGSTLRVPHAMNTLTLGKLKEIIQEPDPAALDNMKKSDS